MKKEERKLKKRIAAMVGGRMGELECREFNRLINAFETAIREDCVSAYESNVHPQNRNPKIIAAIRGKRGC